MRDDWKLTLLSVAGILVTVLYWFRILEPLPPEFQVNLVLVTDVGREYVIMAVFAASGIVIMKKDLEGKRFPALWNVFRYPRAWLLSLPFLILFPVLAWPILQEAKEQMVTWPEALLTLLALVVGWGSTGLALVGGTLAVWRAVEQRVKLSFRKPAPIPTTAEVFN